ncbi:MAG: MSHA biogenesis protein MshK [Betaproteobacteria bacterium]|nr:MSHA biogenesis protein MshK [Betaproteobacteria bacterium]
MAYRMMLRSILTLALAVAAGGGYAQAMQDPMRPPAVAASPGSAAAPAPPGMILQSTLLSNGRRIAMIDGKPMEVGARIGDAKIVAIGPASVTLREGKTTRVLELYRDVQISHPKPEKGGAPRKGLRESSK